MTHRRSNRGRKNLEFSTKWNDSLRILAEKLENRGGDLNDFFELILGQPNDSDFLAQAILKRLGIYVLEMPRIFPSKVDYLQELLTDTGVELRFGSVTDFDLFPCPWSEFDLSEGEWTIGFPDVGEIFDGKGNPCLDYEQLARVWKRMNRVPATLEQVLRTKAQQPDLEIWNDAIIVFGTRFEYEGMREEPTYLKLCDSQVMTAAHYIQMCDSNKRVAYIQT